MRIRLHVAARLGAVLVMLVAADTTARRLAAHASFAEAPVADAAERRDLSTVRTLLRTGADVNAAQGDGMTALHWTALNDDLETMNVLLYAGASTEPLTRIGRYTPLHLASSRGHAATVARLLEAGSTPAAVTATGVQAIHLAAQAGSPEALTALLAKGADVNAKDATHGRTPLVFAASEDRLEAMKLLIARGADITAATTVIDYQARSSSDGAARQTRERVVTAATGRPPSNIEGAFAGGDPAAGAAGRGGARGAAAGAPAAPAGRAGRGAGAAQDPDDPDIPRLAPARGPAAPADPTAPRSLSDIAQIGTQGGFTALHYAARDGYAGAAKVLLDADMDVNTLSAGDRSSPMLVAIINGQFDLAKTFLERGADPNLASDDGATPLFAVLNNEWALRTWYPQPTAARQQQTTHLQLLEALLKAGADPDARTKSHIWYAAYNAGRMGVDFSGATAFWRAAYALDVDAMRLLTRYGADPGIPTMSYGGRGGGRGGRGAAAPGAPAPGAGGRGAAPAGPAMSGAGGRGAGPAGDPSGLRPVPAGGPHVPPFHAASGVGYGTSRVAQQHRTVPDGWMAAAKYFIEDLGVDINMRDADGYTALHHAAARGDNEMIKYLVSKGADVMVVSRSGQTTVDMANSPEQRTQPFPETIKLLEGMGAKNNHNCRACG